MVGTSRIGAKTAPARFAPNLKIGTCIVIFSYGAVTEELLRVLHLNGVYYYTLAACERSRPRGTASVEILGHTVL